MPDDALTRADLPLIIEALRRRAAPAFFEHFRDEPAEDHHHDGEPLPSGGPDDIDDEWYGRSGPIDY